MTTMSALRQLSKEASIAIKETVRCVSNRTPRYGSMKRTGDTPHMKNSIVFGFICK